MQQTIIEPFSYRYSPAEIRALFLRLAAYLEVQSWGQLDMTLRDLGYDDATQARVVAALQRAVREAVGE